MTNNGNVQRVEIPDEFGGGWVDLRVRRSWKASNDAAADTYRIRDGVTDAEISQAREAGTLAHLYVPDLHARLAGRLATRIVDSSLLEREGRRLTVRELLDSDDLDEELGDWLDDQVEELVKASARSKSGMDGAQPES